MIRTGKAALALSLVLSSMTLAQPATQPASTQPANLIGENYRMVSEPGEIISVLDNGLVVIAKRVSSPVCAVRSYVYTGGIYEGRWLGGGLSHLLEHLVAGGSTKSRTEAENRSILQEIGNNSNAYTTADHTGYYINTTPAHMEQAVDLIAGYMFGALITPDEYAREYEVVQRELEKGKGEPSRQLYYLFNSNRYLVSPARVPVIGYQEVIQGLSRDDVYEYYKLAYQPNNMVFSIAGDMDPEQMVSVVRKYASNAHPGRAFSRDIPAEPPVTSPRTVVGTFPKLGQAQLILGYPSIFLQDPDLYALDLLSAVLSAGESSILVEELRDKLQIVTGVDTSSFTPNYAEGTFSVSLDLDPAKIEEATKATLDILKRVQSEPIPDDRIARAKTLLRVSHVRGKQTSEAIAAGLATDYMSTGDPHFSDRYVDRIQSVTAADLQRVAVKYFDNNKLLTSALIPAEFTGAKGLPAAVDLLRPAIATTQKAVDGAVSDVSKSTLDDGTVLLVKRLNTSPLVVMNMYSLGGLTAEDAKTNGIGNLTLSLLERGTKTRSAQDIAQFFDSIGASIGCSSGNNTWSWSASCLKEDFEKTLDVYADVVNNPAFPEDELARYKQRVLAAIDRVDADWTSQAFRFFRKSYYGPQNSPYQFLGLGTREAVESFTADDLRKYYADHVTQSPRVLAIYGDIDPKTAESLARQYLGKLPKVKVPETRTPRPFAPKESTGKPSINIVRVETQKTEQALAGVVIGFESDAVVGDQSNYPILVADTMCSGYGFPTGYLHEILRGRGLVYVVHAMNSPGVSEKLPGTFLAYAGCDPRRVNEVVDLMLENLGRLQGTPEDMQVDWYERAQKLLIVTEATSNETPSAQASQAAVDELFGLGYDDSGKFADRINSVTLSDVRKVATDRLRRVVVTISTPAPDLVKVKTGERIYESFPPIDLTPQGVQHDAGAGPQ